MFRGVLGLKFRFLLNVNVMRQRHGLRARRLPVRRNSGGLSKSIQEGPDSGEYMRKGATLAPILSRQDGRIKLDKDAIRKVGRFESGSHIRNCLGMAGVCSRLPIIYG